MKIQAKVTVTSTLEEVQEATGSPDVLNWGNGWADVLPPAHVPSTDVPSPKEQAPKRKTSKKS